MASVARPTSSPKMRQQRRRPAATTLPGTLPTSTARTDSTTAQSAQAEAGGVSGTGVPMRGRAAMGAISSIGPHRAPWAAAKPVGALAPSCNGSSSTDDNRHLIAAPQGRSDMGVGPDLIPRVDGVRALVHSWLHLAQMEAALGTFDLQRCLGAGVPYRLNLSWVPEVSRGTSSTSNASTWSPAASDAALRLGCASAGTVTDASSAAKTPRITWRRVAMISPGRKLQTVPRGACGDTSNATRWFNVR
jgi:hypothetical protein